MISLYSGTPGSGKSLHCAKDIIYSLKHKKNVIANFPINTDILGDKKKGFGDFIYISNDELLNPIDFTDFKQSPTSYFYLFSKKYHKLKNKHYETLIVFDECQLLFNSRDYHNKFRYDWIEFFSQHRKYNYEIILICQSKDMIDKQIRALIEFDVQHKNLGNYQTIGFLLSRLFGGALFLYVSRWFGSKGKDSISNRGFVVGSKKLYSLYNTFYTFNKD